MTGDYYHGALDGRIEDAIDGFRTSRESAFLADDAAHALSVIGKMAEAILFAADNLSSEKEGWNRAEVWNRAEIWKAFRTLTDNENLRPHVMEELQIALGWKHAPTTHAMAERCLELTADILPHQLDPLVLMYVRRLTRCYVAGFFPECLMVCGSVLEQELRAVFKRKDIPLPATPSGKSEMKMQIAAAHKFRWLSMEGKKAAEKVWLRRCKTVHEDPEFVRQTRETVRLTICVLQELGRI
jgi:hypothetical protein